MHRATQLLAKRAVCRRGMAACRLELCGSGRASLLQAAASTSTSAPFALHTRHMSSTDRGVSDPDVMAEHTLLSKALGTTQELQQKLQALSVSSSTGGHTLDDADILANVATRSSAGSTANGAEAVEAEAASVAALRASAQLFITGSRTPDIELVLSLVDRLRVSNAGAGADSTNIEPLL